MNRRTLLEIQEFLSQFESRMGVILLDIAHKIQDRLPSAPDVEEKALQKLLDVISLFESGYDMTVDQTLQRLDALSHALACVIQYCSRYQAMWIECHQNVLAFRKDVEIHLTNPGYPLVTD